MRSLVIVSVLALASFVSAAGYPGPDHIGIYLDDDAVGEVVAGCDLAAMQPVRLHLCITNPSGHQVAAWEARIEQVNAEGNLVGEWELVDGLNVGYENNYAVGIGYAPLVPNAQGVVTLMTMEAVLMRTDAPIEFYIRRYTDSVSFADGPGYAVWVNDLRPLQSSTGSLDTPVFVINGEAPVTNETATWGEVKSLFD